MLPWSDGLIADREDRRRDLTRRQGIVARKVHVIPRGVDTQRFCFHPASAFAIRHQLSIPAGAPLCGLATDGNTEVAWRQLFAAARLVRLQLPQARFLLIDPPPAPRLASLAAEFQLHDGIHVATSTADLPQALSAMNVLGYVDREGREPVRVLEAMAVQVPVVATTGNRLDSLVQSDCNGFLVPPDDPQQIAVRIAQLIQDPRLAHRLGECGRQHIVKSWSLDHMVRRYEQLICDIYLRKRSGKGPQKPQAVHDSVEFCGVSP